MAGIWEGAAGAASVAPYRRRLTAHRGVAAPVVGSAPKPHDNPVYTEEWLANNIDPGSPAAWAHLPALRRHRRTRRPLFGGWPIAAVPLAVRTPHFEFSTKNCRARFRVLHLQKIYRRISLTG
jgi:hypothetical protein